MTFLPIALFVTLAVFLAVTSATAYIYINGEIDREGRLMRFYSEWSSRSRYAETIDLCSFFWTTLLGTAASTTLITLAGIALGQLIVELLVDPRTIITVCSVILAILGGFALIIGSLMGFFSARNALKRSDAYAFIKGNYCPRITVRG